MNTHTKNTIEIVLDNSNGRSFGLIGITYKKRDKSYFLAWHGNVAGDRGYYDVYLDRSSERDADLIPSNEILTWLEGGMVRFTGDGTGGTIKDSYMDIIMRKEAIRQVGLPIDN